MKISLGLLVVGSLTIFACSKEELSTCDKYCSMETVAAEQDAINKLCEVSPVDLDLYEAKCVEDCTEVLDYVVNEEEQEDATKCLLCIIENTPEPSERHLAEAKEICFIPCNNLGGYQFFFSFFVSAPPWNCY